MKHDPIHDFRSGSVRNTQAIRGLEKYQWSEPALRLSWTGVFATVLVLVALFGMFVVTPA